MPLHRLYGLIVQADRALPAPAAEGAPDITITTHTARKPGRLPANSRGYSYELQEDGSIHVSWSELFDFVVNADGSRIDVYSGAARDREPAYTYLVSQVISVALLQKHIESLHAGAIGINGQAIALLGESGRGKSTLTAHLLQSGAHLITDDLLVLSEESGHYFAVPGASRIKLDPAVGAALRLSWSHTPMLDSSGKDVWFVPQTSCALANTPLARICLLEPGTASVQIETMNAAEATRVLLGATFNPLHTEPERLQHLLLAAERLVRAVPVQRLSVPRSLDRLPDVSALLRSL
ncbi:MAG TPA: hypothetical protein VGD27_10130 [Longimicrobiales bacterium]